jgi:hypothetical protein
VSRGKKQTAGITRIPAFFYPALICYDTGMNTQKISSHTYRSIRIRKTAAPAAEEYGTASIAQCGVLFPRAQPAWAVPLFFLALTVTGCSAGEGIAQPIPIPTSAAAALPAQAAVDSAAAAQPVQTAAPDYPVIWKTYANLKFGYEIKIPLNWWNDASDFNYQSYTPIQAPFCGGGGGSGVDIDVLDNPDNLSAIEFLQWKLSAPEYQQQPYPVRVLNDRMGFAEGLDVVLSEGYMGAGSPGPHAEINTGRGQIIEFRTEVHDFPLEKIFSAFRLIDADPTLKEFKADVIDGDGGFPEFGDIGILDGGQAARITDWGHNYSPLLSPDKTKVAYLSQTKEAVESGIGFYSADFSNNVWIIGVDGSNPVQVTAYVPGVSRGNLHWLDDNRLLFSDGKSSVKVYSMDSAQTSTVFDSPQSIPGASPERHPYFLFNSDYSRLVWFPDLWGSTYEPIAIVDPATLNVTVVTDPIFPKSCRLEFGPDNTTFLGQKEPWGKSDPAVLDLRTGKVAYGSTA